MSYTINQALEKIQKMLPHDKVTFIEQEDGSGLCWNYKINNVDHHYFERFYPVGVIKEAGLPVKTQFMHIDMLRRDIFEALMNLTAAVGISTIENDLRFSYNKYDNAVTFYIQGFHINIKY